MNMEGLVYWQWSILLNTGGDAVQNLVFAQLSHELGSKASEVRHFRKRRSCSDQPRTRHHRTREALCQGRNVVKVDGVVITRPPPVDQIVSRIAADREVTLKAADCAWHVGQVFVAVSAKSHGRD